MWSHAAVLVLAGAALTGADSEPAEPAERAPVFGLNIGMVAEPSADHFSPLVGATWHVADRFALRATLSYRWTESDAVVYTFSSDPTLLPFPPSELTTRSWVAGGRLLWFLKRHDGVSTYLAGGYEYDSLSLEDDGIRAPDSLHRHHWLAGVGAQYDLRDGLALFGDVGVRYETGDGSKTFTAPSARLGLVLYLK